MRNVTWRQLISAEMATRGESWGDVVSIALPEGGSLDTEFDNGFGIAEGCAFTVWTSARVYFPMEYDGSEYAWSVARNPDGVPTDHAGCE